MTHPFAKVPRKRPPKIDRSRTVRSEGGFCTATYASTPANAPLHRIHSWEVTVTAKDGSEMVGADVAIAGDMPEHVHGMTTKPRVTPLLDRGAYRVDGMKFHMPGWWEVVLDVSRGRGRDLVRFNLVLGEDLPEDCSDCARQESE